MCAIAGIIGPQASEQKDLARSMQKILRHRGPDDSGEFYADGVALVHNRLSIIDLSAAGKNPIFSPDGRYAIIYNGEVFNYLELRREIGDRYDFHTATDTEVILASFLLWGPKCLEKFIGMFAFAIWDEKEKKLFCARDRFGIKPFYYLIKDDHFYFASEVKALLLTGIERKPNLPIVYDYLKWGLYDHSEETFFENIKQLRPGHFLTYTGGRLSIKPYWDLAKEVNNTPASQNALAIFEDSVRLALRTDVPIGVNLSGGFDSSLLITLLDRESGKSRLEGFTQDFRDKRFSERPWVEAIAGHTQRLVHFSYMSDQDFVDNAQAMLWYQDEPYAGAAVVGYVGVYQSADRRKVKVLLDGNGLDEAFCGYRQYHNIFLRALAKDHDPTLAEYCAAYAKEWQVPPEAVEQIIAQPESKGIMGRDATVQLATDWLSQEFENSYQRDVPDFAKPFSSGLKNAIYQDLFFSKMPKALRFNDRVSMAFAKELRVPFLDHRLVKLALALPDKILFSGGRPKGFLRQSFKGLLPDGIRLASKRNVQNPQSVWFSSTLRSYLGDIFHSQSFKNRGIIDATKAIEIFNDLEGKRLENSFFLWQAVGLEVWFQMFINSNKILQKPQKFGSFERETLDNITDS